MSVTGLSGGLGTLQKDMEKWVRTTKQGGSGATWRHDVLFPGLDENGEVRRNSRKHQREKKTNRLGKERGGGGGRKGRRLPLSLKNGRSPEQQK